MLFPQHTKWYFTPIQNNWLNYYFVHHDFQNSVRRGLTVLPQIIKTIVRIYPPLNFNTNLNSICHFYSHTLKLLTTYSYDCVQQNQDGLELNGLNNVLVYAGVGC